MALKMSAACLVEGKLQTHGNCQPPMWHCQKYQVSAITVFWTFVNDKFGCLEKMHAILAKVYHN